MQLPSLAHPAQPDTVGDGARGQVYPYPHPLTLARDHAGAERIRLADSAAYSPVRATRARLGGLTTLYRCGPSWFRLPALGRREPIPPKDPGTARPLR
jgi:hypothetical protein